jgi:hypothetical protein
MVIESAATDAEILTAIISPVHGDLEPGVADAFLRLRFSPSQVDRMQELADKGNQGVLTPAEASELESYRRVGNFLSIMQAKARLFVKHFSNGE